MGYKLTDIVNELMIEIGEGQTNKFGRFFQLGVSGLRQMNLNTTGFPKITELTIGDNDTADLPNDYINYTRIALCINGVLWSLGNNPNLCLVPEYDDCGNPVAGTNTANTEFGYMVNPFIADNYRNGSLAGRMFGIGGDNNMLGYYRIDMNTRKILFSNLTRNYTVVLEYISDISAVDGDFEVHPFCVEALKDWMFWMYKSRSSKPLGEQQLAKENWMRSNRNMRMMFASRTKEDWVAAFQSGNNAAPKM